MPDPEDIHAQLEDVAWKLAGRLDQLDPMNEVQELARACLVSVDLRRAAERERKALKDRGVINEGENAECLP
jgi:hypothetical protein